MRSVDETLNVLQDELHSVESQLSEPDVASDLARLRDLSLRHKELLEINNAWIELKAAQSDFSTAKEMFNETSGDDRELWREEMNNAEEKIPELEVNLETLLLPHDPNEGRNVILELSLIHISDGTGRVGGVGALNADRSSHHRCWRSTGSSRPSESGVELLDRPRSAVARGDGTVSFNTPSDVLSGNPHDIGNRFE